MTKPHAHDRGAPARVTAPSAPQAPVAALPTHVILLADHGDRLAGRVLAADPDLLAQLDAEHAKYRPATPAEISVGATGG